MRIADHASCGHWQTHAVVAALRPTALTATAVFDGPIDTTTFQAYVDQVLVPTLRPGLLDRRTHFGLLVGREVVEDDDVARGLPAVPAAVQPRLQSD